MTYTKLAVGFIVRFREHRDERGHLLGGPFLRVGAVDHGGVRRFLAGGGFAVGVKRRPVVTDGTDGWYGFSMKYREWLRPKGGLG